MLQPAHPRQPSTVFEKSLHAALKAWYTRPGDQLETRVSGYVIDIIRQSTSGVLYKRRKSPKQGCAFDIFNEMISLSGLVPHNNLSIEVLLTRQEEILRDDGRGSWRRQGWSIHDRRLLEVLGSITLQSAGDFFSLLPTGLPQPFTNRELAIALHRRVTLARKMTYTLCKVGCIEIVGKAGNARLYNKNKLRPSS
jgi:hypothetical protein